MEDRYRDKLDQCLGDIFESLRIKYEDRKIGVLFSAGVDSSTVAVFARDYGLDPILYNFGTEFSKDKAFAFRLADDLALPLVFEEIPSGLIEETIPCIREELEKIGIEPNMMQVALALGVYFIGKRAKADGIDVMLCGQGSDELFAGYSKYEGLSGEQLQSALEKGLENVISSDLRRDGHMLSLSGIGLEAPYVNPEFAGYALSIPLDMKIKEGVKKYVIRKVAQKRGLPEYIALRPKSAMQYSSGIQKVVDKITKAKRAKIEP